MIHESVYVPGEGGTRIAVDAWAPAGERPPAVLMQHRYWRGADLRWPFGRGGPRPGAAAARMLAAGYAVVDIDVRGAGASFGARPDEWPPEEAADAAAVLDWIVSRPWSDGRVAAVGISYGGTAALLLAARGHPALRAGRRPVLLLGPRRRPRAAGRRPQHLAGRAVGRAGRRARPGPAPDRRAARPPRGARAPRRGGRAGATCARRSPSTARTARPSAAARSPPSSSAGGRRARSRPRSATRASRCTRWAAGTTAPRPGRRSRSTARSAASSSSARGITAGITTSARTTPRARCASTSRARCWASSTGRSRGPAPRPWPPVRYHVSARSDGGRRRAGRRRAARRCRSISTPTARCSARAPAARRRRPRARPGGVLGRAHAVAGPAPARAADGIRRAGREPARAVHLGAVPGRARDRGRAGLPAQARGRRRARQPLLLPRRDRGRTARPPTSPRAAPRSRARGRPRPGSSSSRSPTGSTPGSALRLSLAAVDGDVFEPPPAGGSGGPPAPRRAGAEPPRAAREARPPEPLKVAPRRADVPPEAPGQTCAHFHRSSWRHHAATRTGNRNPRRGDRSRGVRQLGQRDRPVAPAAPLQSAAADHMRLDMMRLRLDDLGPNWQRQAPSSASSDLFEVRPAPEGREDHRRQLEEPRRLLRVRHDGADPLRRDRLRHAGRRRRRRVDAYMAPSVIRCVTRELREGVPRLQGREAARHHEQRASAAPRRRRAGGLPRHPEPRQGQAVLQVLHRRVHGAPGPRASRSSPT